MKAAPSNLRNSATLWSTEKLRGVSESPSPVLSRGESVPAAKWAPGCQKPASFLILAAKMGLSPVCQSLWLTVAMDGTSLLAFFESHVIQLSAHVHHEVPLLTFPGGMRPRRCRPRASARAKSYPHLPDTTHWPCRLRPSGDPRHFPTASASATWVQVAHRTCRTLAPGHLRRKRGR